ncbi:MAG: dihydroorotase family protein [Proteobacteria bacterium]|nr:dihydroorotase family protein [Pseudomonadota bacterium]
MYDLIIRDATLVTNAGRQVADVALKGGKIAYVGPRPPRKGKQEISAIGKFLIPGVIDTGAQFDPNGDPKAWERESRAAVTGGVTTVIGLPWGDQPSIDRDSARARLDRAKGKSWCHFALWGAATGTNQSELDAATEEKLILGALAYLGQRQDGMSVTPSQVKSLMQGSGLVGVQMSEMAQDERDTANLILNAVKSATARVHLMHLSTTEELDLLDPVRGQLPLTAGVTPHHLFLSIEPGKSAVTTFPPMGEEHDRRTLWTAMKRGRLDCIASDHYPSTYVNGSTVGIPSSELLFPLLLSAVKYGRLSLELLASLCAEAPARIFGLENKGCIKKGADADLVLFSEGELTKVSDGDLLSGAGWSPYLDREAAPKPELVFIDGAIVARRGELVAKKPTGRHLLD